MVQVFIHATMDSSKKSNSGTTVVSIPIPVLCQASLGGIIRRFPPGYRF
jgi:hypothetical protein